MFVVQVLPYDHLMQELDVTNVRELEDFLINECMYAVCIPMPFLSRFDEVDYSEVL